MNLKQPDHVKPRFVSNAISVGKIEGQKTLADIAHFESCARQPFQKCHGSGAAFFFHFLRWWWSSHHTLGKLNLTKVTHHHFDSCVLTCSGSFSTSSPECPVQSSLLACEYRVKRRTWVQWVTFDWLKAQQIVCFWLLYVFLCLFEVIFCFLP